MYTVYPYDVTISYIRKYNQFCCIFIPLHYFIIVRAYEVC